MHAMAAGSPTSSSGAFVENDAQILSESPAAVGYEVRGLDVSLFEVTAGRAVLSLERVIRGG
jgi:hypothetical protein